MTKRLEEALRQLPDDQIEKVADFAEILAKRRQARAGLKEDIRFLKLDWVGMAADAYPEHSSGVEAAHAAAEMIRQSVERSLSK